ncbi:tripartite tricarboxylate transporter TctB family protein [Saccharopolyspora sp. NFXS83]|uniref:tripartite tricarboxylate transporter TctB family protein n=1 Tax=Saccharopolyspora sp. NFXS83 TaxID=2993560 RepID=UPI00224A8DBC|nr:tripartite tricarboxylate transporter TctB family protein [Saccharopolyspora sp. NFXS83]MCX2731461.1 tripartite tricarboxylate transporter TctB family protein [Saccharopolyspora sp. NFXS83]
MTTTDAPTDKGGASGADRLLAGLVLVIGAFLVLQGLRLPLPLNVGYLGPQWFPIAVGVLLIVLAGALVVQAARKPAAPPAEDAETPGGDWRAFGIVVATLAAHLAVLVLLGWIPAGAVLFWGVARALGSSRALFDLGVAVVFSCTVQFAFTAGLGIALPIGLLAEVL